MPRWAPPDCAGISLMTVYLTVPEHSSAAYEHDVVDQEPAKVILRPEAIAPCLVATYDDPLKTDGKERKHNLGNKSLENESKKKRFEAVEHFERKLTAKEGPESAKQCVAD